MPKHIHALPDIHVFRKLLKTHLFNLAFNVHFDILVFIVCDSRNAPMFNCSVCNRRTTNALDDDDDDDEFDTESNSQWYYTETELNFRILHVHCITHFTMHGNTS